ncbi:MAG TPA: type VI secretion system contractile sheath large subunit [Gammaproteobacteria bacterium]
MTRRAELEVTLGRAAGGRRSAAAKPFRALVLAGFSGAAPAPTMAARRISADDFDAVLHELAPTVSLEIAGPPAVRETLKLTALDDFHPDRLLERVAALREPSLAAAAPPTVAEGARELAAGAQAAESDADLLGRLLGQRASSTAPSRAQQKVRELIEGALAGATAAASPARDDALRAARTALLRAILNDSGFRDLERAWRSVHFLATRLDEDQLELHIADLSKAALSEQLARSNGRLEATPLHALLVGRGGDEPWDAVVTDYTFTLAHDDLMLLAMLGALAARVPAPLLAHADLSLCGCRTASGVDAPWDWKIGDDEVGQLWHEVRRHPAAKQLVLAAPRFVLRHPYGRRTDPIESFGFEELPSRPSRDAFLWASPAFACAYWLAAQGAAGAEDSAETAIDDLPAPSFDDGRGDDVQPPLEVLLTERARAAAEQHGIVALAGGRNTTRIAAGGLFAFAE